MICMTCVVGMPGGNVYTMKKIDLSILYMIRVPFSLIHSVFCCSLNDYVLRAGFCSDKQRTAPNWLVVWDKTIVETRWLTFVVMCSAKSTVVCFIIYFWEIVRDYTQNGYNSEVHKFLTESVFDWECTVHFRKEGEYPGTMQHVLLPWVES